MEMECEKSITVPGFRSPGTWLIGAKTRAVDSWSPGLERIFLPALWTPIARFEVGLGFGQSSIRRRRVWLGNGRLTQPGLPYVYDARSDCCRNVAHMVDNVISRILLATQCFGVDTADVAVVLPAGTPRYISELFMHVGVGVVETNQTVAGRFLQVKPDRIPRLHGLYPDLWAHEAALAGGGPNRLFVSRRGSRSIVNEGEVVERLADHGFERVYMEDHSIKDQLTLLAGADALVAVHGASLGLLPLAVGPLAAVERFHRSRCLIELFGPGYIVNRYRQVASRLGYRWLAVRGRLTPEVVRDVICGGQARAHEASPLIIDLDSLDLALSRARLVESSAR